MHRWETIGAAGRHRWCGIEYSPVGQRMNLVAKRPTIGVGDICFRWSDSIESAVSFLKKHHLNIVEGPVVRRTGDGLPSQSVYFCDPDGNLLELMAVDES